METLNNTINLDIYRAVGDDGTIAKIFTGRDRGKAVREASKIDEIESKFSRVYFIIPDNIYSINPSFFEELFYNVVMKLGRTKFLEKFEFKSEGGYEYERPLQEAISRILRTGSALG